MIFGVPKEIKIFENRVSLTPQAVQCLVQAGHVLLVKKGAGLGSGFSDRDYQKAGAQLLSSQREVYQKAELVVKVKEPQPSEYIFLRPGLGLFAFLHLAAIPKLKKILEQKKVRAIPFETIQDEEGRLPLLAPMSEIAGRLSALVGVNYLRKDLGGKGVFPGRVTILGAGHVGSQALKIAHGLGSFVTVYDINSEKLKKLQSLYSERLAVVSTRDSLSEIICQTDLLIGAVLIPGQRAPLIVSRKMIQNMEPGSVVVDVAVDQGGCIETIRPTTLKNPVFKKYGVLHYGVTNIPSLVPRTATESLSSALLPYLLKMGKDRH